MSNVIKIDARGEATQRCGSCGVALVERSAKDEELVCPWCGRYI